MCREARCRSCGKTTWAGCGNHVDAVMSRVPKQERCSCERRVDDVTVGRGRLFRWRVASK